MLQHLTQVQWARQHGFWKAREATQLADDTCTCHCAGHVPNSRALIGHVSGKKGNFGSSVALRVATVQQAACLLIADLGPLSFYTAPSEHRELWDEGGDDGGAWRTECVLVFVTPLLSPPPVQKQGALASFPNYGCSHAMAFDFSALGSYHAWPHRRQHCRVSAAASGVFRNPQFYGPAKRSGGRTVCLLKF